MNPSMHDPNWWWTLLQIILIFSFAIGIGVSLPVKRRITERMTFDEVGVIGFSALCLFVSVGLMAAAGALLTPRWWPLTLILMPCAMTILFVGVWLLNDRFGGKKNRRRFF